MSWQRKGARGMENGMEQDETKAMKNFSSLPVQLRQFVLLKTDTRSRMKLFQINSELREWVLEKELFGEELETIQIWNSGISIKARYGSKRKIVLRKESVFKVVRSCKELTFGDCDYTLAKIFPRLKSINVIDLGGANFTRLSEMFMGSTIQVTGYCRLDHTHVEGMTSKNDENFLQFIENHLKRCKTVHFGRYSLENLFAFLGSQHFRRTIFCYSGDHLDEVFDFERDLKMIMKNGLPGLHPDSAIWMIIDRDMASYLTRIIRIISERNGLLVDTEAIRKKFLASYEKVGSCWVKRYPVYDLVDSGPIQFINGSNVEFFGLKRKFDDKRNLIFLVHVSLDVIDPKDNLSLEEWFHEIHIHIKFDPIEE